MKLLTVCLSFLWLFSQCIEAASVPQHIVQVLNTTTLHIAPVIHQRQMTNSSTSLLPTWNASAAFTFRPSNTSSSAGQTTALPSGGSGLVGGLIGGLTSSGGLIGGLTSALSLNISGIATGLPNITGSLPVSAPSLSMPSLTMPSLSLPSLSLGGSSSVRWPNSTTPTSRG